MFGYSVLWRKVSADNIGFVDINQRVSLFDGGYPAFAKSSIVKKLSDDSVAFHYLTSKVVFKHIYVEPRFFTLIKFPAKIISESEFYEWQRVSIRSYLNALLYRKHVTRIDEAVLLDSFIGLNYFHFYNDVLPVIRLIYENNLEDRLILIGEKLFAVKWFQFYLRHDLIKRLRWKIVSQEEYVSVKKLHFFRAKPYAVENFDFARKLNESLLRYTGGGRKLKVFVLRSSNESRHVNNFHEFSELLFKRGFIAVDLALLSVDEQIVIFRDAEIVIGPHGAGLTNLIFSDHSHVKFLELFPNDFISAHYYWLSSVLGIRYAALSGSELLNNPSGVSGFSIDPAEFERAIDDLLSD